MSISKSERIRRKGNEYFAKHKLNEAMEAYNASLILAPHGTESYAYALGNRSAVFFEMKAYEECLRDIERALSCPTCPKSTIERLRRRKDDCETILAQTELTVLSVSKKNGRSIPELYGGTSPSVSCASAKVAMDWNERCGRRLVAVEDIEAGSVLIVENPYASVLLDHTKTTHCHHCHQALPLDFIPCHQCCGVRFCSETCLELQANFHAFECGQVERLYQTGIAYLAYKIFMVTKVNDLAEFIRCQHQKTVSDEGSYGLKSGEIFDGGCRCVFSLVTHHDEIHAPDFEVFKQAAVGLAKLAVTKKKWPKMAAQLFSKSSTICDICKSHIHPDDLEVGIEYLTLVFQRLVEMLCCNANAISEVVRRSDPVGGQVHIGKIDERKIGTAIYPTASLMNHSCVPNIFSSFIGKTLVVRATRNIKAGEEILNCYGPQFGHMLREERQKVLKEQYYFDCGCCACTGPDLISTETQFMTIPECEEGYSQEITAANGKKMQLFKRGSGLKKVTKDLIEDAEEKLSFAMQTSTDDTSVPYVMKSLSHLTSLLNMNNKIACEWREKVAEWLIKSGKLAEAAEVLGSNIFPTGMIYGRESVEAANEIMTYLEITVAAAQSTNASGKIQAKKESFEELCKLATEIFEIYYGKDCEQAEEIKEIKDKLLSLL